MRKALILLASASGLIGSAALAQTTQPEAPAEQAKSDFDDIVVTARRREESLQDVPVSISALSGEAIIKYNVGSPERLADMSPGLTTTSTSSTRDNLLFAIRGQRATDTPILIDPAVGFYFGEIVQPRNWGFARSIYDLQSVQVLKGVQGTLFGRNMTGGAILIEPHHPVYDLTGEVKFDYGNLDNLAGYGMINIPVVEDKLAIRANVMRRTRDGFTIDNRTGRDYDNIDFYSGRFSVLFAPSDKISTLTIFDGMKSKTNGAGNVLSRLRQVADPSINPGGTPFAGNAAVLGAPGVAALAAAYTQQQALGVRRVVGSVFDGDYTGLGTKMPFPGYQPYERTHNWGITSQITVELSDTFTFRNIAGYRDVQYDRGVDFFNVPINLITSRTTDAVKQYSEEAQLKWHTDSFDGIVGAFGFHEKGVGELGRTNQFTQALANPALGTNLRQVYGDAKSAAAYAAGTYKLTDQFKLSAGIRYNYDKRSFNSFNIREATGACLHADFPNGPGVCRFDGEKSWSKVTYDATLQWMPNENTNIYVAYRKGYRAGGFNARSITRNVQALPFDPEDVTEIEGGLKQKWQVAGIRGTTNIAVYDQKLTNAQVQNTVLVSGILTTIINNVGRQHNVGGEFETTIATDVGLQFKLGYAYNDIVKAVNRTVPSPFGSPKHQASLQSSYTTSLANDGGDLTFSFDVVYKSKILLDDVDTRAAQKGYALLNARIAWENVLDTNFSVSTFVANLTNKLYKVQERSLDDAGSNLGLTTTNYGEPRTYGLSIGYSF